jgi:putative DNA methylase
MPSFIEVQFPVSKVSKESYKERKAGAGQTLTGLGKWWGRKPLILVRATILGLLLPATDNPKKDREIFLKILTMDEEGLWLRKSKSIPLKVLYSLANSQQKKDYFSSDSTEEKPKYKSGLKTEKKTELQKLIFNQLSYDEKLNYTDRPEHIDNLPVETWAEINEYLGTNTTNLPELIQQLGVKKFGHIPKVGDAFCGGGSVPFEAARIGCEAYGSDLNPVATLLTWASLNIVGGGEEVAKTVREAQEKVYNEVDKIITEWGIEHNNKGWRADAYLYCNETRCPECGWLVPLAPSWVIAEKTKTIAQLVPLSDTKKFDIIIKSEASKEELKEAKNGTVKNSALHCPHCNMSTPITMIRGDRRTENGTEYGLRLWENDDLIPRPDDVFQERLYFVRWVETYTDDKGKEQRNRYYLAPDPEDLAREKKILQLLQERFKDWQEKGYLPSRKIESGNETDRLMRERGWTHWHHLFNPRQLLISGSLSEIIETNNLNILQKVGCFLSINRIADWNSRLCRWITSLDKSGGIGGGTQTFYNQAFNALYNYNCRTFKLLDIIFFSAFSVIDNVKEKHTEIPKDARNNHSNCDFWITDPPYADAVNYHELTEFFLAWYEKPLQKIFPDWYTDSKRALAVSGRDENFRKAMVDCYKNLADNMPDEGMQVVMFTHQDAKVWADLALILWASGLRVTSAWCIATETDSALKQGNYVQGTVLLVLRKQTSTDSAFLDELNYQIEDEVKAQLNSMLTLEDDEEPNFSDTDYQLAAYAAALRVLTQYKQIEDFDIAYELSKPRQTSKTGEKSPIEELIDSAVKIACDYLVPKGFDTFIWKTLTPDERFYLKGLDMESHGEYRSGAYQELARGFGIREYTELLATGKANETHLKTATDFGTKLLNKDSVFSTSLVRNALFAIREVVRSEEVSSGKNWLRNEVLDYWNQRKTLIEILKYLAIVGKMIPHWEKDADASRLLAGAVENDNI